jgi:hypothetical protein
VTGPGCQFADRCPVRLPVCLEQRPPLYRTAPRRAAACVRLNSDPVLAASDFSTLLSPGPRASRVTAELKPVMVVNASGVGATPS